MLSQLRLLHFAKVLVQLVRLNKPCKCADLESNMFYGRVRYVSIWLFLCFDRKLIKITTPKFMVVYNGKEEAGGNQGYGYRYDI